MKARTIVPNLVLVLCVIGCATMGPGRLPNRIVMARGGMIPEGIEFDTTARRLLTGSLVDGTVYEVERDGTLSPFIVDAELVSSIGIEADEPRDRLLVANSDRSVIEGQGPGIAKLGVYRLSTGTRLAMVDLAAAAGAGEDSVVFVNDVTVDDAGNAYVTDTWLNLVYRVDTAYNASVLYRFEPMTGLGLNGIVYHPNGYLIVVAVGGQGLLFRIPVDDPGAAKPIELSQPATGADGLVWTADGRLAVVSNSTSSVMAYTSNDGWNSGQLVGTATFDGQATTGAAVDDDIYIVQPHFNDDEAPVVLRIDF